MEDTSFQEENLFLTPLYQYESARNSLAMDKVSGRVVMVKRLSFYSTAIYQYLKDHANPHVPTIYALQEENGVLTVVEEYVSGCGLDYILANDLLNRNQRVDVILQLLDALIFLHAARPQIIHRDIKPANIVRTDEGLVKLVDYNAAKTPQEGKTKDTVLIGTQGSAAPEQYGFGQSDARTDLYAMGVLIRELFPENDPLQKAAAKATRLDPDERYQSALEMKTAILRILGSLPQHRKPGIPGFRSGTDWKMTVAIASDAIFVLFFVTYSPADHKLSTAILDRIVFIALYLCGVDLFFDGPFLSPHFPGCQDRRRWVRILSRFLWFFLMVFVLVGAVASLEKLLPW